MEDNHIFQGLRRDNHQIKQDSKFLWDAHNIRLTNRDDSTLLSITNERGPHNTNISFEANYVGHCIVGNYLVIFTSDNSNYYIYRVEKTDEGYTEPVILFEHHDTEDNKWTEGWSPEHPIEALGVYETELVQKVYWIDGEHQPRVINITRPELLYTNNPETLHKFYQNSSSFTLYPLTSFDFVNSLSLNERVEIEKIYGDGEFPSGVIQYAFTYYNKYLQESKIWYTTPVYYTSFINRGGNGEEKVSNSFRITISNIDKNFQYIRIYSILRTSIDGEATVKRVRDLCVDGQESISFIDTGTIGDIVDPKALLYVGGMQLIPSCITHKDNTLFLGNIKLKEGEYYTSIRKILSNYSLTEVSKSNPLDLAKEGVYYEYSPNLKNSNTARFKTNEYYRLGIQAQFEDGSWSNPIHITDDIVTDKYPWESIQTAKIIKIKKSDIEALIKYKVKSLRTCVVFPAVHERDILFQGILNPTVYSVMHRKTSAPYAMSSWFFRPATSGTSFDNELIVNEKLKNAYQGAVIQFRHNKPLFTSPNQGAEIQSMASSDIQDAEDITEITANTYGSYFFVDENIISMHSPDVEFDSSTYYLDYTNVTLNIIGIVKLGAIIGDIDIRTSSATASEAEGFVHNMIGYKTGANVNINGGLVMGNFYRDSRIEKNNQDYKVDTTRFWPIYPFHRSGSVNNDEVRPSTSGQRTSVLSKKIISNLKFFSQNISISEVINYPLTGLQLFSTNTIELLKLRPSYLNEDISYLGNIETVLTSEEDYSLYEATSFNKPSTKITDTKIIKDTKDAVSMKYKSTPHMVFSLGNSKDELVILPRNNNISGYAKEKYSTPEWIGGSRLGNYDGIFRCYQYSRDFSTNWLGLNGMYYIDISHDDNRLGIFIESGSSSKRRTVPREEGEGLIIKVVKDITVLQNFATIEYIPGTNPEDYRNPTEEENKEWQNDAGKVYIGKDLYFKIHYTDDIRIEVINVTAEIEEENQKEELSVTIKQDVFSIPGENESSPYLLIGELVQTVDKTTKFGGDTDEAKRQNLWIPSSPPVSVNNIDEEGFLTVPYIWGDTWYQRYDCLKTYPFTNEDENQIVEIGSFMCETRVNIDGRWDRNRGQLSNLQMTPQNFNLINEVYSQKDNFFNYRILDEDYYKNTTYANQVTWSLEKQVGGDVDNWTQISLANILNMDGTKGAITKLSVFNENLICLQEKALSTILFNSRVQIPVSDGVPVEISNGYKVDGYRFINDSIGCQNKWSVCNTSRGLYFIDDNTDTLWAYSGEAPVNMTDTLGMKWWFQNNHSSLPWNPRSITSNGIRTFYDPSYGDVYFTPGPEDSGNRDAICFSEQLAQFVSQYSYGGVQAMFPFNEDFLSLRNNGNKVELWQNFKGEYNEFFGDIIGWDFSFISNDNPTITKIFDTLEVRADSFGPELLGDKYSTNVQEGQPFNFIQVSNEYQDTYPSYFNASTLRKKFRVWRAQIPRNKLRSNGRDRIRNPWAMITLGDTSPGYNFTKIHDISVKYTI